MKKTVVLLTAPLLAIALSLSLQAQSEPQGATPAPQAAAGAASGLHTGATSDAAPSTGSKKAGAPVTKRKTKKLGAQQQFALDVVQSAVARNIVDPQDRLRVLETAVNVLLPLDPKLAKQYAAEGVRLEGQMIGSGQTPSASLMETGQVDCKTATEFVDQLPPQRVMQAEQSIIGAANICPEAATAAQAKMDAGAGQQQVVPRAFMAVAEHVGLKSPWSQSRFERLMQELPDAKAESSPGEAPNLAAMYSTMAPQVDPAVAQKTGLEMLGWLANVEDSPERNLAVRVTTDSMKKALGAEKYDEALRGDVIAQQTSRITGSTEISHAEDENVSVLQAIQNKGQDQSEKIKGLPPTMRAKEAAASGFAEGTSGNKQQSAKYFDIAYAALDEAWQAHPEAKQLAETVEEINEAAAQVDYVDALKRAEALGAPAEQAIGMLAVARTVLGKTL